MNGYQLNALLLKDRIKSSFSKAALRYDSFASLQREVGEELLKMVISQYPTPDTDIRGQASHITHPVILDIGCGTGFLTYGINQAFPDAPIFGCDISHEMTKLANGKMDAGQSKKMRFIAADGGVLPFQDNSFDMVASSLAYQWLLDLKAAFSDAYRVLRQGGQFTFSTLGPETLKELRTCYDEALNINRADNVIFEIQNPKSEILNPPNGLPQFISFSDEKIILSSLEDAGFGDISIEKKDNIQTYPDMWSMLKTMKSIGAGNPFKDGDKSLARGSLLKRMTVVYEKKFGVELPDRNIRGQGSEFGVKDLKPVTLNSQLSTVNCIYATYEVLFVRCVK